MINASQSLQKTPLILNFYHVYNIFLKIHYSLIIIPKFIDFQIVRI